MTKELVRVYATNNQNNIKGAIQKKIMKSLYPNHIIQICDDRLGEWCNFLIQSVNRCGEQFILQAHGIIQEGKYAHSHAVLILTRDKKILIQLA